MNSYEDLWFTEDGDFLIDSTGDIASTSNSEDPSESIKQGIMHKLVGEKNAYAGYPNATAGLEMFIGRPIDVSLIEDMEGAIHRTLRANQFLDKSFYQLRIIEILSGQILIAVYLPSLSQLPIVSAAWNSKYGEVTKVN